MQVRPRCIPGHEDVPVQAHVVETEPGRVRLALSIDPKGVASGPIHRGQGPPYVMIRGPDGERLSSDLEALRRDLRPVAGRHRSHLQLFRARYPDRRPIAVTGCGNLGLNAGVLAAVRERILGVPGAYGAAVTVNPDGTGTCTDDLPSNPLNFAVTGPALVRDGHPCAPEAATFADPRHLLLFPYVEARPGIWVDFGQDAILSQKRVPLYQRAVEGESITLSPFVRTAPGSGVEDQALVPQAAVRKALAVKGYPEDTLTVTSDQTGPEGVWIPQLAFRPGIYPHHVLALRPTGTVCSVLVSGLSNRAGVRVAELAEDLVAAGFQDAILLDNGGDVGLYLPQEQRFVVRPAAPERKARWPLTACLIYWQEA